VFVTQFEAMAGHTPAAELVGQRSNPVEWWTLL
jgi:hypothetical protein